MKKYMQRALWVGIVLAFVTANTGLAQTGGIEPIVNACQEYKFLYNVWSAYNAMPHARDVRTDTIIRYWETDLWDYDRSDSNVCEEIKSIEQEISAALREPLELQSIIFANTVLLHDVIASETGGAGVIALQKALENGMDKLGMDAATLQKIVQGAFGLAGAAGAVKMLRTCAEEDTPYEAVIEAWDDFSDSLTLAEKKAVIAYGMNHREQVLAYIGLMIGLADDLYAAYNELETYWMKEIRKPARLTNANKNQLSRAESALEQPYEVLAVIEYETWKFLHQMSFGLSEASRQNLHKMWAALADMDEYTQDARAEFASNLWKLRVRKNDYIKNYIQTGSIHGDEAETPAPPVAGRRR